MTMICPQLFPPAVDADAPFTTDDYYTPPWLFDVMALSFDLDVCGPRGGVPWLPATQTLSTSDDGLSVEWVGRVWMNPPFSNSSPWVDRFIAHAHGVCLVPHSRAKWHSRLWATADILVDVNFVGDKLFQFYRASDGAWTNIYMPVFVAAFGAECVEAVGRLGVGRAVA